MCSEPERMGIVGLRTEKSGINRPGVCLDLVENFEGSFVFDSNGTHPHAPEVRV